MRTAHFAIAFAILAAGNAVAQEQTIQQSPSLKTIEVRAEESERTIVLACIDPQQPSLKEVEQVLSINDPAQTVGLRSKLMAAAAEACAARQPRILVTRGANGGLTWKPLQG